MTRRTETIPPEWFDALYGADPDPWRFRTSAYERAKYDATLKALGERTYRRGLEVGCAIGVLTRDLAQHCEWLLAVDASGVALEVARRDFGTGRMSPLSGGWSRTSSPMSGSI